MNRYGIPLVQGSAFALPFKDNSFDCLISSEVIEHIAFDDSLFTEMRRVLKPDGTLILGTPDYSTLVGASSSRCTDFSFLAAITTNTSLITRNQH